MRYSYVFVLPDDNADIFEAVNFLSLVVIITLNTDSNKLFSKCNGLSDGRVVLKTENDYTVSDEWLIFMMKKSL